MKSPHHEHEKQIAELAETRLLKKGDTLTLPPNNLKTPVEITLAPNAKDPATLIVYRVDQPQTDRESRLFMGNKGAGGLHETFHNREQTFDPEAAYVIVSEADVSATQDDAGFIMLYAGQTITIGREQAGSPPSLRENSYVSRGHLILSVDEGSTDKETGRLTIEDTSLNGTRVRFSSASPWDDLREAPTALSEPDGLPSLIVPYDDRFTPSSSGELPPLAAPSYPPVTRESSELPSLISRDEQSVGTEVSPKQAEPSHDQGELMDEMPHRVKELLEWRSRAIGFVGEQVEGMLSALHKNDGSKLKRHLNRIEREASNLTSIANTGSELLSTTLASSVDNETRELLEQSQEMYKHLLDGLNTLLTCTLTDLMDLSAYNSQVEFRWNITGVKELIGGIQTVDQKLIHRFNQEG